MLMFMLFFAMLTSNINYNQKKKQKKHKYVQNAQKHVENKDNKNDPPTLGS